MTIFQCKAGPNYMLVIYMIVIGTTATVHAKVAAKNFTASVLTHTSS